MKGVDVAISDPIPPVDEYDKRLPVKELITENRDKIDEVRDILREDPLYDPQKHDDLWILRFLLSHKKNVKKASKASKSTLLFRQQFNMDEKDIRRDPPGESCCNKSTQRYFKYIKEGACEFVSPDPKRGVLIFANISDFACNDLVKNLDESEWLPHFSYITEFSHQWLDFVTRTTGRLTKQIRIIDLGGISMSDINMESNRRDGKAMGVMEDCYPQLLQRIFICNSPTWIQVPWRICRPLMPRRVVEKLDFITPDTKVKEKKRLLEFISEENLPVRYGGENKIWPVKFSF